MNFEEMFNRLNDEQKEAVLDIYGPSMVIAGPGAGKTAVLVTRAANMIRNGIPASEILLFTFTKKAATEIRERIDSATGDSGSAITIGTYHSICSRILRQYAKSVGLKKNYTIYDQEDASKILKDIASTTGTKFDIDIAQNKIANYRHQMINPSDAMREAESNVEKMYAKIYEIYSSRMISNNCVDFDSLIYFTVKILEQFPDIKREINNKYKYIVADESHDSSISDLRLIYNLAGDLQNICMIADNDQSIYAFRGSKIEAVMNMTNVFTGMKIHMLNTNYRSTQTIVNASRSLIDHNTKLIDKKLVSNNGKGDPIIYFQEKNPANESNRIVSLINIAISNGYTYNDIAILYRMNFLSRQIEDGLLKSKIPYKIIGGVNFYGRKEIKDIMSYFKIILNPNDSVSLSRSISTPKRSIGEKTIEKVIQYSMEKSCTLLESVEELNKEGRTKDKFTSYLNIINKLKENIDLDTPDDLIKTMLRETGYIEYLTKIEKKSVLEDREQNINELIDVSSTFDSMQDLVENMSVDMNTQDENEAKENCVKLLTMHSSKGLEWPFVIIAGANEGVIPSFRAKLISEIEEERRLFYVAMTRAKEKLFITRPSYTMVKGRYMLCKESRFLREIRSDYILKSKSIIS